MTPLHTLVLIMLQLSSLGCEGEDLFGAVATLLCLLFFGGNPSLWSELSISSLFGANSFEDLIHGLSGCDHEALVPLQLANVIYSLKNAK